MFSPEVCPDTVDIPETDTFPAKTMNVLQGVRSTTQIEGPDVVTSGNIDMDVRTNESKDRMSAKMVLKTYCLSMRLK